MPRDHRFGLDENECFGPVGPDLTNDHPEQAIESIQLGARLPALVNSKLLSKRDRLQCQTVPRDQKRSQVREHRVYHRPHHSMLIAARKSKLLITEAAGVLMTHRTKWKRLG
jgi:hypothetical protein